MGIWRMRYDDSFSRLMHERARKRRLLNELEIRRLEKENDRLEGERNLRRALAR